MKALKVKISGSYWDGPRGNVIDYQDLEGIIPFCDEDVAELHLRRFAPMWISADKEAYPDRVHDIRELFIDKMETIKDHTFSYVGKDVKEMSSEELQDLATAKDLRRIPLWKKGSTREQRVLAYVALAATKGKMIDPNAEGFNFADMPPLKADDKLGRNLSRKVSNDEFIEAETKNTSTTKKVKSSLTLAELKALADEKGIEYPKNVKYDDLYHTLYGV